MGLGGLDVFVTSLAEAHDGEKLKITNVGNLLIVLTMIFICH
ncbi:hypothetical protein [Nonlabens tegetincola]|nr:hypothetical protein [Nonlabens tegetincola]